MNDVGMARAARARACLGVRFRLHGRMAADGLDCIGLAAVALGADVPVPDGYALRGTAAPWLTWFATHGFVQVAAPDHTCCGDFWLLQPGPRQCHIGVQAERSLIHAHAGLGRVVATPLPPVEPVIGIFRPLGELPAQG